MAESKKPASKAKAIADVAQPGKTPPPETSRSIITHRTLMQDPMVVKKDTDEGSGSSETPASSTPKPAKVAGEIKLQPLGETEKASTPTPEAEPAVDPESTPEPDTEPKPEPDTDDEKPQGSPDKPSHDAEAAASEAKKAEHDAAVQKLIDNKQYFLPVNAVERRRSKRFVALGVLLSLLLIAAWANIALDAGLLEIPGVKPVTHFFST